MSIKIVKKFLFILIFILIIANVSEKRFEPIESVFCICDDIKCHIFCTRMTIKYWKLSEMSAKQTQNYCWKQHKKSGEEGLTSEERTAGVEERPLNWQIFIDIMRFSDIGDSFFLNPKFDWKFNLTKILNQNRFRNSLRDWFEWSSAPPSEPIDSQRQAETKRNVKHWTVAKNCEFSVRELVLCVIRVRL